MKQKNSRWLVVLGCINALLLTAVVMHFVELPQAQAQTARTGSTTAGEYLMVPGRVQGESGEIIWVLDVNHNLLTNCIYNRNRREIQFGEFLDLNVEYGLFKNMQTPVPAEPEVGGVK